MRRDPIPLEQPLDYVRADERVPRAPRTTPSLLVELVIVVGLGAAIGAMYALPALQSYLAMWGLVP